MILVDINLLIYAKLSNFDQHPDANLWLDRQLGEASRVGLPWHSLLGFVRLATNPRFLSRPLPMARAWRQVEEWLEHPSVWVPQPTPRHRQLLTSLLGPQITRCDDVPDAHLAALAIEHGLILCSSDRGFARFPDLRWSNPLAAPATRKPGSRT